MDDGAKYSWYASDRRRVVSAHGVRLAGNVSEISRPGLYVDQRERVTVSVHGAEPLYAELRVLNEKGWKVGQQLVVVIVAADSEEVWGPLP
jgi:hypothetical protein